MNFFLGVWDFKNVGFKTIEFYNFINSTIFYLEIWEFKNVGLKLICIFLH